MRLGIHLRRGRLQHAGDWLARGSPKIPCSVVLGA
jgi:hypothetical protein